MTRRHTSRFRRLIDNTLVVGLVALGIAAIVLAISYRAQNGLPWLATYDIQADVPDAAKLLKNADVRIGGARVGQVLKIEAHPGSGDGPPFARLDLALNPDVGPLPADSTVEVRLASVLGGKFLDLVPGKRAPGTETIPDGGVLPLEDALPAIDQDDALQVFRPQEREAARQLIGELADAFAGRGVLLNQTMEAFARSLPAAERVLGVLGAPETDLAGFVRGAADAAEAIAPLADELGPVIDDSATTFEALDAGGDGLEQALAELPGAEAEATTALTEVQPVLDDAAAIVESLRPAGDILEGSLRSIESAMRKAAPVATRAGNLAPAMREALEAVDAFSANPSAIGAIEALKGEDLATFGGSAFVGLGAILRTATTAQLECNTTAIWARNMASIASEGDRGGNWLRMIPVFVPEEFNHAAEPAPTLHVNYYPHQNSKECEAGNEPFTEGQLIGNPPGLQTKEADEVTRERTP